MPADLLQSPLINYTITYSNTITNTQDPNYVGTLHSARVVAYLPRELDPDLDLLGGGTYDTTARTVTWTISQLDPGHSGTVIFSATVNSFAKPGVAVRNVAQFEFDPWAVQASVNTPICYYGGPFIYVDPNATGLNNGTAWTDAFTDISEAVASANLYGSGAQVWMKKGIYRQATALTPISGVSIYGSFAGRESSLDQRIIDPNSSIITGDTNDDGFAETATLLSLNGVTDVRIDGIAFTMSGSSGISIQNATGSNIVIANCTFSSNSGYYGGLYANSADPCVMNCHFASNDKGIYAETTIDWVNGTTLEIDGCSFSGNSSYGIYLSDAGAYIDNCEIGPNNDTGISCYDYGVEITESWIHDNSTKGVYCTQGATASLADCTLAGNWTGVQAETYADLTLNRCLISGSSDIGVSAGLSCSVAIYNNIIKNSGSHGIYLTGTNTATVTNCWIVNNGGYGIDLYNLHMPPTIRNNTIAHNGSGGIYRYETGHDPDILNTIFWQNGTGGTVDTVGTFGNVTYSRTSTTRSGAGNMTYDPCFADPCNGDYHLKAESQCIDKGQTVADCYSEHDIDDNPRVRDGDYIGPPAVDMGAHEYYQSLADLNHDRRVNFKDYAILMWSWGKSTGQPGWNGDCDFVPDNSINYKDLACMLEDWLWQGDVPNLPGCDLTLLPQQQQQQSMMMSVSGNSGASMASLSRAPMSLSAAAENVEPVSPSLMAQQLQENIAFLYEAAQESPDDANSIYEFISKLEQSLNELSTDQ
jgi:parallel beta-helix repeat protein